MKDVDAEIKAIESQLGYLRGAFEDLSNSFKTTAARMELVLEPYREEIAKLETRQKKLALSKLPICSDCEGSGIIDPGYHNVGPGQCRTCKGTGHIAGS